MKQEILKSNVIGDLKQLLRDQYSDRCILKELVQNAEDAKATQVHLAVMKDWPDGMHPLLEGPVLLVLNDGAFNKDDHRGILQMHKGSKEGNKKCIGRFGVGMKSIFHLCDAFFFLASEGQEGRGEDCPIIVNPWADEEQHTDWGEGEGIGDILVERIEKRWDHGCKRWFCLVIPFRKQSMPPHILKGDAFPKADRFLMELPTEEVAKSLALLRHVSSIKTWTWEHNRCVCKESVTCVRGEEVESPPGEIRRTGGKIYLCSGDKEINTFNWSGYEILLPPSASANVRNDKTWPTIDRFDPNINDFISDKEDVDAHSAVVFIHEKRNDDATCSLRMLPAVFLPLSQEPEEIKIRTPFDVNMLLHGTFSVDAGRHGLYESKEDSRWAESAWNNLLKEKGITQLALPALSDFAVNLGLNDDEIERLTKSLYESKMLREWEVWGDSQPHRWTAVLDGTERVWKLFSSKDKFFELPSYSKTTVSVFPAITEISRENYITAANWPRLPAKAAASVWPMELLGDLLSSIADSALSDAEQIQYLTCFLKSLRDVIGWKDLFRPHFKRLLKKIETPVDRKVSNHLKELVEVLGCQEVVPIDVSGVGFYGKLLSLNLTKILIPKNFLGINSREDEKAYGDLSVSDAASIFRTISGEKEIERRKVPAFCCEVLRKCGASDEEKFQNLGDFSLFPANALHGEGETLMSWRQLRSANSEGRLFKRSIDKDRLLSAVDKCFPGLAICIINESLSALFQQSTPATMNCKAALSIVEKALPLAVPEERTSLLKELLGFEDSNNIDRALRYLLHGSKEKYDSDDELFHEPENHNSVLLKIMRSGIENWRIVPRDLSQHLSPRQSESLRVTNWAWNSAEDVLGNATMDVIALSKSLNETERIELLCNVKSDDLWQRLPLHKTMRDVLVSIDGQMIYMESKDYAVPTSLQASVTVLANVESEDLKRKYDGLDLKNWSPSACLEVILSTGSPDEYQTEILDALDKHGKRSLSDDTKNKLSDSPWLHTSQGFLAPGDFVHLPKAEEAMLDILPRTISESLPIPNKIIPERVKNHPGFTYVSDYYASPEDSLIHLGEELDGETDFGLGDLSLLQSDESAFSLADFLKSFEGIEGTPVISLLELLFKEYKELMEENLMPHLATTPNVETVEKFLKHLPHQALKQRAKGKRDLCRTLFNNYLKVCVHSCAAEALRVLRGVRLLNQEGEWKTATELCAECEGIPKRFLLDSEQGRILESVLVDAAGVPEDIRDTSEESVHICDYLKPWEGLVRDQILGGFLALLGNEPRIRKQAEEYLTPHTLNWCREATGWQPHRGSLASGAAETIHEVMRDMQFTIHVHRGETLRVQSIIGDLFDFPKVQGNELENLFLHNAQHIQKRHYSLMIQDFDPSEIPRDKLASLLLNSALHLFEKVYVRSGEQQLESLWEELAEGEQFGLELVQEEIIEDAFSYLREIGLSKEKGLDELKRLEGKFNEIRSSRREAVSLLEKKGFSSSSSDSSHDDDVDNSHNENLNNQYNKILGEEDQNRRKVFSYLRRVLMEDVAVQNGILNAVKKKMGEHYQYSQKSIPFELFQNSDDAVRELIDLHPNQLPPLGLNAIQVVWNSERIVWMHWGRLINQVRSDSFSVDEGKKRGFHRDLSKMLRLSTSDKDSENDITGKFGLGFKSVFLLSERPRVLSGDLGFEILAGFYPLELPAGDREVFRGMLGEPLEKRYFGTLFELRADKGTWLASDVMTQFVELLPLSLTFSRQIKNCTLHSEDDATESLNLVEEPLQGAAGVFFASPEWQHASWLNDSKMLVLRGERNPDEAITFLMDSDGFSHLPDEVPTMWVTCPTDEILNAGFVVNGRFDLDVGRARISPKSQGSIACAERLGKCLAEGLRGVFLALSQAASSRVQLGIEVDDYVFWLSLWNLVASYKFDAGSGELLKGILWGEESGLRYFYDKVNALPSELPGSYRCLTRRASLKYAVAGILDEDEDLFTRVSCWPNFSKSIIPSSVVSASRVGKTLREFLEIDLEDIDLAYVLEQELPSNFRITPESAEEMGNVLTQEFVKELKGSEKQKREAKKVREHFERLTFLAESGDYVPAKDLLHKQADSDEALRASFAPKDHILSEDYSEIGIKFFMAARGHMSADAKILAEWGMNAVSAARRKAFITYLAKGELGEQVGTETQKSPSWLNDPNQRELTMAHLSDNGKLKVRANLGDGESDIRKEGETIPRSERPASPGTLKLIHDWWLKDKVGLIKKYEESIYPDGRFPEGISDRIPKTEQERIDWLTLFLAGILHSMGRTIPGQHREFIRRCRDKGWLQMIAEGGDVYGVLQDYVEKQSGDIEYYQWMKQLLGLCIIATHLDEYIESLLSGGRFVKDFECDRQVLHLPVGRSTGGYGNVSIESLFNPRTAEYLSHGGPDAPPITPILGMGAFFVVRELVRKKILTNGALHRWCFVPRKQVCVLLHSLGCRGLDENTTAWEKSAHIFTFLEGEIDGDSGFDLCFDIPFFMWPRQSQGGTLDYELNEYESDTEPDDEWEDSRC